MNDSMTNCMKYVLCYDTSNTITFYRVNNVVFISFELNVYSSINAINSFMHETLFLTHGITHFMKWATQFLPMSRNRQVNTR